MEQEFAKFNHLVDLIAKENGGEVLFASDDFFASKENLIKPGRGTFDPDLFNKKGKVYDGWESKRNRSDDNDYVVAKLAKRGIIKAIDIDTNHFIGNAPQFASIEVINTQEIDLNQIEELNWKSILPSSSIKPGKQNLFHVFNELEATHVRFQIYPDGGVARLRLYGEVIEEQPKEDEILDYASILNGGKALVASDMFFGNMNNLLKPNIPENMGDGWETKRRRGSGHDWVIVELGQPIIIEEIEVDTMHFKGNYPETCSIEVCHEPEMPAHLVENNAKWETLFTDYKLEPDNNHKIVEFQLKSKVSHVRLNIFPDGGIARFRVYGS